MAAIFRNSPVDQELRNCDAKSPRSQAEDLPCTYIPIEATSSPLDGGGFGFTGLIDWDRAQSRRGDHAEVADAATIADDAPKGGIGLNSSQSGESRLRSTNLKGTS